METTDITISDTFLDNWETGRRTAKTVEEKNAFNVWDNLKRDVLPILKASLAGKWFWYRNQNCKYINVRIDMRTGQCIISDNNNERINPEDLRNQCKR